MLVNIAWAVLGALSQLGNAWLAYKISVAQWSGRQRRLADLAFVALGLVGVLSIGVITYRGSRAERAHLSTRLDNTYISPGFLVADHPLSFNLVYSNVGNGTAYNLHALALASLQEAESSASEARAISEFKSYWDENISKVSEETIQEGQQKFITAYGPILSSNEIQDVLSGKKVVYVVGDITFEDDFGGHIQHVCQSIEPFNSERTSEIWQDCHQNTFEENASLNNPNVAYLHVLRPLSDIFTREIVIGALIGAVLSGLVTLLLDWLRRPRLSLTIERPPLDRQFSYPFAKDVRWLRLNVVNRPFLGSTPALQCRARISFRHLSDGQNIFGRHMEGRWAGSPQPIALQGQILGGPEIQIWDPDRIGSTSRVHIYRGDTEEHLDIAARIDNDADCYGWNNESYGHAWRNPDWKLGAGRYLVGVEITSTAKTCFRVYRLMNDVSRSDFRLEAASRADYDLVKSAMQREKR